MRLVRRWHHLEVRVRLVEHLLRRIQVVMMWLLLLGPLRCSCHEPCR
jgi:hypothetical protein